MVKAAWVRRFSHISNNHIFQYLLARSADASGARNVDDGRKEQIVFTYSSVTKSGVSVLAI